MSMKALEKIIANRKIIKNNLIHCITHKIAVENSVNAVLLLGAKAICAENPVEVSDITKASKALSLSLGNITSERMESIFISSKVATENNIPQIIDLVGIAISSYRYEMALKLLSSNKYEIIKGNASEIKKLAGLKSNTNGIDVGEKDKLDESSLVTYIEMSKNLSKKYNTTVLITGEVDILTKNDFTIIGSNGNECLTLLTGTGCILNSMIAAFLSEFDAVEASLLALLILEISAELAADDRIYTFKTKLFDKMATITDEELLKNAKVRIYKWKNYI